MKTPLETLSEYTTIPQPLTLQPKVFGCTVFVHIPKSYRDKLDPCAEKCVFVGYGVNQKGYRCYSPKTHRLFTSMNCDFLETQYYYSPQHSGQGEEQGDPLSWLSYTSAAIIGNKIQNHSTTSAEAPNISATPEHPVPDMISEVSSSQPNNLDNSQPDNLDENNADDIRDPTLDENNADDIRDPTSEIVQEHEEEVPRKYVLPPRSNRGVPPKRYSPEKTTRGAKYPMANIAEGNLSNNAKAFAVSLCLEEIPSSIEQALKSEKWKNAIDDEMKALKKNETWDQCALPQGKKVVGCRWIFTVKYKPDGTVERYKARLVAKGYTQTYGIDYSETFSPVAKMDTIRVLLSVASNQGWSLHQFDVKNAFLHGELKEEVYMEAPPGFSKHFKPGEACRLKKSLYGLKQSPRAWFGRFTLAMKRYGFKQSNSDHTLFLKNRKNRVTCLIIYVDDMVITGNDEEEIKRLKEGLFTEFEMKDLGNLKYFLGIEVLRSPKGIFICQKKYILDLLAEIGMINCKPADTPMMVNQKLFMEKKAKLADKNMYQRLVGKLIYLSHTRPDIAYDVRVVSRFMHQPQVAHMNAVLRIVRYLKGTAGHEVLFRSNGHLNIQMYTDADWAGDKGTRRSTSGYFTLVGGNLVTWRRFPPRGSTQIMCDNKAAIQISENPVQHDRTKHVEVDRHFIKEKLEAGIIELPFVKSSDQLADQPVVDPWNSNSEDVHPSTAKENAFIESDGGGPNKRQATAGATPLTAAIKAKPTVNHDFYHEPFIFKETEKEVHDLVASPFTKQIRDYDMPDDIKVPTNLRAYDGMIDPDDHLTIFMGTMDVHKLPEPAWCRFFHITLCGAARFWFQKTQAEILGIRQRPDESLKDCVARFSKETLHMVDRSDVMISGAFISGLRPERLFKDLIAKPPTSLEDLFTQTHNFI
ncbi:retrovirus-related pol polyprotein from transposon TNT 1-94 [Tanacetum coccineum]